MHGTEQNYQMLACAILHQAVKDAGGTNGARLDAGLFLRHPVAQALAVEMGIEPNTLRQLVDQVPGPLGEQLGLPGMI